MMTISLGKLVKTRNEALTMLKERPLIKYSKPKLLQEIFPEVQTDNLADMFRKSNFVTSSMVQLWDLGLHFYKKGRYADVVMVLLPQLEHSLRRVYACCNHLPERLHTAESSEFYTTFNEILSPVLANGTCNNLLEIIGPCYTEMLLDILMHQEGPRLRDHIGHGEVDMFDFPKDFANHLLCISIALCLKFSSEKESRSVVETFREISKVAKSYSSIFHPCSCLHREYLSYINDLLEWEKLPKPHEEEFMCDNSQCSGDEFLCKTTFHKILRNCDHLFAKIDQWNTDDDHFVLQEIFHVLKKTRLSTLFRPRHELEVVAILRNIVSHCLQTSKQIQQTANLRYEEWEKKELRSRQRKNYKRFWSYFPFIERAMSLFVIVVGEELLNIENVESHSDTQVKFLKRSLQCAENLASLSSLSRNRWMECADIGELWVYKTHDYYS